MADVRIENSSVTYLDVNRCVEEFIKIRQGSERRLRLIATVPITEIPILLIGYFILFKEELPDLHIELRLLYNTSASAAPGIEYKLKQFGSYAYLMTGQNVFTVQFSDDRFSFDASQFQHFPKNWYVLSDKFMLLLMVSTGQPELYRLLFEKGLEDLVPKALKEGVDGAEWKPQNLQAYREINRAITAAADPKDRLRCIVDLGRLAFFKSLLEAKVLNLFTHPRSRENHAYRNSELFAGNLSSHTEKGETIYDAYSYFEDVRSIFEQLRSRPLCYHFIYATLLSSELLATELTHENREKFTERLFQLWQFTGDLVHGLKELAKNIEQHSTSGKGVICASIFKPSSFFDAGRLEGSSLYKDYADSVVEKLGEVPLSFLEIHVIDLGSRGIIPTLAQSTSKLFDSIPNGHPFKTLLRQDVTMLHNRPGLDLLLSEKSDAILNQQLKRSIAHYGLLILSKLITNNNGLLIVSSFDAAGDRKTIMVPEISPDYKAAGTATGFTMILPIHPGEGYQPHLPGRIEIPRESSVEEMRGLEALFRFHPVVADESTVLEKKDGSFVVKIELHPNTYLHSREQELVSWQKIQKSMWNIGAQLNPRRFLVHLDFEKILIGSSQLLRLLGLWETEFPRVTLLLSNIPQEIFEELLDINRMFLAVNPSLDFWNAESSVILYSYIKDEEKDLFYFTDVLWGRSESEFNRLNRMVHRNHFNATTLLGRQKMEVGNETAPEMPLHMHSNPAFFNHNVLLPFDLLLKNGDGQTLFECNARMLLKNEIKHKS